MLKKSDLFDQEKWRRGKPSATDDNDGEKVTLDKPNYVENAKKLLHKVEIG